jgi:hypothetical protein
MLKTLDILIGVATVMLLFSMVVTIITQFVISALQSRGRNLKNGLAGLLKQLDPTVGEQLADEISAALLKHPLTAGRLGALGTVIHREEFTTLLMELASGQSINQISGKAKNALNQLLKNNGIQDPAATLKNVRDFALQLESSNPELANNVRHSMAILQEAKSEFVGKIHGWFDQTIDRVSQRFTLSAHAITFIVALVLAFAVQLDTIGLVNRLSSDDAFRAAVTSRAETLLQQYKVQNSQSGAGSPAGGARGPSPTPTPSPTPQADLYKMLQDNGLITSPQELIHWQGNWPSLIPGQRLLGILISALLLSLGAPFWYSALQNLLRLRSALAQKDDQQRQTRQTTQEDGAATKDSKGISTAPPALLQGEKGNLQAVG